MKKKISVFLMIVVIIIIVGIISYKAGNRNQQTGSENKIAINNISVGKPCDAGSLKSYNGGGSIANTRGLQCYVYDDLSDRMLNNGAWVYPSGKETVRKGVWVYPNHMSIPVFLAQSNYSLFNALSIDSLTQNWKLYSNSIDNYSFKFFSQWKIKNDIEEPNQLIIEEPIPGDVNSRLATITYYPNTIWETTKDYQDIKEVPDNWLIPDNSTDTFILSRNFDLNGTPALLVERMANFDLGGSSYMETIYIARKNSYFKITYTKYQDADFDLPIEVLIKTLRFK